MMPKWRELICDQAFFLSSLSDSLVCLALNELVRHQVETELRLAIMIPQISWARFEMQHDADESAEQKEREKLEEMCAKVWVREIRDSRRCMRWVEAPTNRRTLQHWKVATILHHSQPAYSPPTSTSTKLVCLLAWKLKLNSRATHNRKRLMKM